MKSPLSHSAVGPYRILIAEDDATLLESFAIFFRMKGHEVATAPDGAQALKLFKRYRHEHKPIQLLITDINMPVMDGEDLVAAVRAVDKHLSILVMTNAVQPSRLIRLMKFGCIEFIDKPFRSAAIIEQAEKILSANAEPAAS